jgi:hypothetical protein
MQHPLLKYWPITALGLTYLIGGVWWAATVQTQIAFVQRDISEIKAVLVRPNQTALR